MRLRASGGILRRSRSDARRSGFVYDPTAPAVPRVACSEGTMSRHGARPDGETFAEGHFGSHRFARARLMLGVLIGIAANLLRGRWPSRRVGPRARRKRIGVIEEPGSPRRRASTTRSTASTPPALRARSRNALGGALDANAGVEALSPRPAYARSTGKTKVLQRGGRILQAAPRPEQVGQAMVVTRWPRGHGEQDLKPPASAGRPPGHAGPACGRRLGSRAARQHRRITRLPDCLFLRACDCATFSD